MALVVQCETFDSFLHTCKRWETADLAWDARTRSYVGYANGKQASVSVKNLPHEVLCVLNTLDLDNQLEWIAQAIRETPAHGPSTITFRENGWGEAVQELDDSSPFLLPTEV